MGFVDDQSGACRSTARRILLKGRNIAVHTEQRLGNKEVVLLIKIHTLGARQAHTIDQAGMIAIMRKNRVARFGERSQYCKIRKITTRKIECALGSLEASETLFYVAETVTMTAQQARTSTARAPLIHRRRHALLYQR